MSNKVLYKSDSMENVSGEIEDLTKENIEQKKEQNSIDANPENVEQGLAKLVLTLIKLIKRLLEEQGVKRMESGSLSEQQIEDLGETFYKLDNKLEELKEEFKLEDEDLNLNLGPLGDLM
ncbi:MAG: gas vesicle protein K [Halanaerobiales bacterium]|nr:gas vesicle protein K [Halanaerobiales bacterium]